MSDKYYDEVNLYPKSTYTKNNGEITKIKTIRLTQEELSNWDSKAIHEFLQGNTKSKDSIRINTLKENNRVLMKFFEMVIIKIGDHFDQELDDYMISNENIFRGK